MGIYAKGIYTARTARRPCGDDDSANAGDTANAVGARPLGRAQRSTTGRFRARLRSRVGAIALGASGGRDGQQRGTAPHPRWTRHAARAAAARRAGRRAGSIARQRHVRRERAGIWCGQFHDRAESRRGCGNCVRRSPRTRAMVTVMRPTRQRCRNRIREPRSAGSAVRVCARSGAPSRFRRRP